MTQETYNITDLPKEPADEWEFLKAAGEPVYGRMDFWECDVCGWTGAKRELDMQTDYARDDAKIVRYSYYVCPECKYPGINHVVERETIHRTRERPMVGDPAYPEIRHFLELDNKQIKEKREKWRE